MPDPTPSEESKKPEKKKGPLGKLKESMDSQSEQLAVLSTFVRLGVVVWSGFILTLNYVELPGLGKQERIDPTFIASVFTGVLASFGIQTASKKGDGTMKMDAAKAAAAANGNGGAVQTLRIEQAPLKIIAVDPNKKDEKPYTL